MPRPTRSWKRQGSIILPETLKEVWLYPHFDFRPLASRTVREYRSVVLSLQVGGLLWQYQERNADLMHKQSWDERLFDEMGELIPSFQLTPGPEPGRRKHWTDLRVHRSNATSLSWRKSEEEAFREEKRAEARTRRGEEEEMEENQPASPWDP